MSDITTKSAWKILLKQIAIAVACGLFISPALAQTFEADSRYQGHTLPQASYAGYQPSIQVFVEQDASGQFHAINAEHARFNRVWMDQDRARVGNDAVKALLKMAVKHLYRLAYQRGGADRFYLPNEEGRISLRGDDGMDLDYRLHLSSNEVMVGFEMNF
ncbi:hypothetical protein GCM10027567_22080 [Spongiibacter taiwanensis]